MKKTSTGNPMPMAHVAINKSRLKAYSASTEPTYYLKDGSEFQIELFNPTTGTILAKIKLDNTDVTQGGLIIKPGERIFLDRYIDVAKKFLFSTYEVSANNAEVKEAIKNNGNFKVEFFREVQKPVFRPIFIQTNPYNQGLNNIGSAGGYKGSPNLRSMGATSTGGYVHNTTTNDVQNLGLTSINTNYYSSDLGSGDVTFSTSSFAGASASGLETYDTNFLSLDSLDIPEVKEEPRTKSLRSAKSKTMETGRVEKGSHSNQKFQTVDMDFEYLAFHTVTAKILPESQKVNTSSDLKVKSYCTQCGGKQKKEFKFCPVCGTKN